MCKQWIPGPFLQFFERAWIQDYLKKYLQIRHFKIESVYSVSDVLQRGDWMAKLDIQDAYLSVWPVFPSHRRFLRFQWGHIGLAKAPRIFTKLMRVEVVSDSRLAQYLDNTPLVAESPEALKAHLRRVANQLEELGYWLNKKKCIWIATERIELLGVEVDSNTMHLYRSLIPRPLPQLSSLAVRITLRRPGENYHVMYATVYVTQANYSIL